MKSKILSLLIAILCFTSVITLTAYAEESADTPSVEVTVSILNGSPVVSAAKITVTDTDGDGILTLSDALYCAHEAKYSGGAKSGYAAEPSQFGLSLTKLWGDTSGSFGYYLNNQSPQSLLDTVNQGDYVAAFIYQDTLGWSDAYSYYDKTSATVTEGNSVMLTLSYLELDNETWMTTVKPAEGATVIINGRETEYTADRDGKLTLTFDEAGTYVVSARSDLNIVPPVCVVTVEEAPSVTPPPTVSDPVEEPQPYGWIIAICAAVICAATAVAVALANKNGKKK